MPSQLPTSSPVSQQRFCADGLDAAACEAAIAAVIRFVPENAGSTVAVVALVNPPSSGPAVNPSGPAVNPAAADGFLVAFAPIPGEDVWLNPPTWTVSSTYSQVEPWRAEQWPPHFVALLVMAGLVGDAPPL